MVNFLEYALKYMGLGWSVIPIEPCGKRPLINWSRYQSQRSIEGDVRAWWNRWPDANVGVVTGAVSGIVVVDVDGEEGKKVLAEMGLRVDQTVSSCTGKGYHYFFKHPGWRVLNRTRALPGVDVRGDGGYVVAPPSVHPSGRIYQWVENHVPGGIEPAVLPERLCAFLKGIRGPAGVSAARGDHCGPLLEGVSEGARNDAAARLAGLFLSRGFSASETLALLLLWNGRNRPPLEREEIVRVVRSIASREARRVLG